jgi:subtilisin family serine protease
MPPVYRLPPYTVQRVETTLTQTIPWGVALNGVPDLWKSTEGAGVKVCICDTGVDQSHPDLAGAILAARDFSRSPAGVEDLQGHGTHVAGVVAARNNDLGVVGVAPQASLLIAKVLGDDGSGSGPDIAAGIHWGLDKGARIISMSLGSPEPDDSILDAIRAAVKAGAYVIMAAGNDGSHGSIDTVGWPARSQLGIAVAAVDKLGRVAEFSSRGPEVDIAAPGQDILSTFRGHGYAVLSGTSMSTPFVAGVVALLLARNDQSGVKTPVTDLASLKEHLAKTALDAGPVGRDPNYGWGLIDPKSMLTAAAVAPPPVGLPPILTLAGVKVYSPAVAGHRVSLNW